VRALGVIELQGSRESFENTVGRAAHAPTLEALVVLDADPGQRGHLFAPQALDATRTQGREADLLRGDPAATAAQELGDVAGRVHANEHTPIRAAHGCPAGTPLTGPLNLGRPMPS
jgi:hypothetical protein